VSLLVYLPLLFVWGLVVGGLARFAVPGPDPMGVLKTAAFGIAGSLLGGIVSQAFLGRTGGFVIAFAGAFALVLAYRLLVQRRPLTGPRSHGR
jgi:uncharacterized membrane protein YeaQ/YmgE (transglycosylase-associated protein family)